MAGLYHINQLFPAQELEEKLDQNISAREVAHLRDIISPYLGVGTQDDDRDSGDPQHAAASSLAAPSARQSSAQHFAGQATASGSMQQGFGNCSERGGTFHVPATWVDMYTADESADKGIASLHNNTIWAVDVRQDSSSTDAIAAAHPRILAGIP